jgi:acetyl-CoA hydrolase
VSRLTHIVPVNYPVAELPMGGEGEDEISKKIAGFIAELIPDGATLQMGIGAIPDAVLGFLGSKKDLGIHSEMFSDGVVRLVEAGVITNARKTLHPGKIVVGFVLGTQKLYSWVHDNPVCDFHRQEYVNDPFVIAQNEKMVAINSALEVDLTGQVCADSIGTKFFSGVGGQLDFVYGASRSKGGVPIIALPSTASMRDGTVLSRIVTTLKPGAGVTTSRNHIQYVVTEYGVASLYGQSIRQRAHQLIAVAHPDFRKDLEKQATELHYI